MDHVEDPMIDAGIQAVSQTLLWLHSKKHDEKDPNGIFHREWQEFAHLFYSHTTEPVKVFEREVHKLFGRWD